MAALEGALAGGGIRERLARLRLPPYSPSLPIWIGIGVFYYVICFIILRHLIAANLFSGWHGAALSLLGAILIGNALWNLVFFRLRALRMSFVAFIPYGFLALVLAAVLVRTYPLGAWLWMSYCIYLVYGAWWGYRVWQLNGPNG